MQELMEIGWHKHCYSSVLGSPQVVTKPHISGGEKATDSQLLLCSLQMLLDACSKGWVYAPGKAIACLKVTSVPSSSAVTDSSS